MPVLELVVKIGLRNYKELEGGSSRFSRSSPVVPVVPGVKSSGSSAGFVIKLSLSKWVLVEFQSLKLQLEDNWKVVPRGGIF